MLEGIYAEGVFTQERVRPYIPRPIDNAGLDLGSQSIFRYAQKSSDYPTLILPEPIFDGAGEVIKPGYYELALSDMRDFLILIESKTPRAIIPVFKIEEDISRPSDDRKYKKKLKKEAREREVINKKRAKAGQQPDIPYIHTEASIEYVKEGDYYLIKYEHGTIRAWGAFKGG
ncbi:MAG: hypothetical protein LBK53_08275 [Heliobacteriaceae bacterium]|nr:hypothetical protein [Heliobacteriaceae bacterium]